MSLTDEDIEAPYDPAHGPGVPLGSQPSYALPATAGTTPPPNQSPLGQMLRSYLPIPDEARNMLAAESPTWSEIASGANERVNYLYDRLQKGATGDKTPSPPMDIPTRALGSIFEGVGQNPIIYAMPGMKYAAMEGNLINEFGSGFPAWQRNLLGGASMLVNPRQILTGVMHNPLSHLGGTIAGVTGRVIGGLLHSPLDVLKSLGNPTNWMRAVVAGHEAGRTPSANDLAIQQSTQQPQQ